ncbi:hypothetical protein [Fervidibacillus halotolerans]|uniref:Chemotaxis protein n=1 Tax=Fervidibacillus halotolerans TaxID=2980027 RepID=A0A9E8RZU0_9BACI|nr:hypothetical protein [Fervidibacillus halotolerans]WAA11972.1 hypothetical protein OE105_10330 [Fervidibacillus halotolerans]
MPLPLIPLIVAGATAASAAIAGKKGYDSYQNIKETKAIAEKLESKYGVAHSRLEKARKATNNTFEKYGLLKLEILDHSMKNFVDTFKQIKNVHFKDEAVTQEFVAKTDLEEFIVDIEKQVVKANHVFAAGATSIAGGGLAAMGAIGATTAFASASTGTAIASLSGIAAKNATLAFLGGGALSAGGLGVAGGTMVLGGIALAPALAIGSLIFSSTTEKKLEEMYKKKAEIEAEIQKINSAINVMKQIERTTIEMYKMTESTKELFDEKIKQMKDVIYKNGVDYNNYSEKDKNIIYQNYKLAVIMKEILNTSILTEDGELAPNLNDFIKEQKQKIYQFGAH